MGAAAFGGDHSATPTVQIELLGTRQPSPTNTQQLAAGTPEPPGSAGEATPALVSGFSWPIPGGCLPESDDLMPGAPRPYRNGTHEGVDFYDADNCASISVDTEVLAAKAGTIVRADWSYQDLTADELSDLEARAQLDGSDPVIEDAFRGRQVWIEHGDGTVTRYAHLNGIAEEIAGGMYVDAGQLIGYVGESGTPESVTDPGHEYHLHFEIRIGEQYLGQGLPADELRALYEQAFVP